MKIKCPWKVGELKFDKRGEKLILLSFDGTQLFVYSTLNFKNNDQPVQKLWRDYKASEMYLPMSIFELQFPQNDPSEFNLDLQLVLLTSADGCTYIFRLINQYELEEHIEN